MGNELNIHLPNRISQVDGLSQFADNLQRISYQIGFKVSARGWCYQLEGFGLITKAQFDHAENIINSCRDKGYLPIDFTAEEEGRKFSGVEHPETLTPIQYLRQYLESPLICENWYTPDWWDGEEYYIQMVVEKIDLKTLFAPVCSEYHIPIATAKGWSSKLQRAEYARRFKEAEDRGLACVLLYCGDHDPDGLRISDFLHENIEDLRDIVWEDGETGYDPQSLVVKRFGLDYDFIQANGLTWIDNLITGSKRDLALLSHPNHYLPYVQDYLAKFGARKCEANALVIRPTEARAFVRKVIERYVGSNALDRFTKRKDAIIKEISEFRKRLNLDNTINKALETIKE